MVTDPKEIRDDYSDYPYILHTKKIDFEMLLLIHISYDKYSKLLLQYNRLSWLEYLGHGVLMKHNLTSKLHIVRFD